jgi:rod shape-determining protein MreC
VLAAGATHGVKKHQPVTVNGNFVGQISSTGAEYSRLLLVTDSASRISVRLRDSGGRAFLFGNGTHLARLRHFELDGTPELGEIVMTSGLDENVPADIPIGIVGAIERDGSVLVQPFVAASEIEVVSILASKRAVRIREFLDTESP